MDNNKIKPEEDIELTPEEAEALGHIKSALKEKLAAAEAEKAQAAAANVQKAEKEAENPEAETTEETAVSGRAAVDGVAVRTKDLVNATEDYPIVLMLHEDFEPVKKGAEIITPYDAVLAMNEIQIVGPMIRVIIKAEEGYNIEK